MPISEAIRARLAARQEEMLDFFLEHSDTTKWPDIATRDGRGDLSWHTKVCGQVLGIAIRIESLMPDAALNPGDDAGDDEAAARAGEALVREYEKKAKRMLRSVK